MNNIAKFLLLALLVIILVLPVVGVSAEEVDSSPNIPSSGSSSSSSGTKGSKVITHSKVKSNIEKTKEINKDAKSWLKITNTNINYPIVQGKDNKYYENRKLDGTNLPNNSYKNYVDTAVFLDWRVKLGKTWENSSKNIVIYGHNWNNLKDPLDIGNYPHYSMFAQLPSYTDIDFAKKNPYIYFSTGDMEGIWKVFAVGYCEADSKIFPYNTPGIKSARVAELSKDWKERSLYNFDVDVDSSDQLLTLATCTRVFGKGVGADQTYVVVARRLRSGESENQAVTIVKNPNIKQPSFVK